MCVRRKRYSYCPECVMLGDANKAERFVEFADAAGLELAANPLPGDRLAAEGTLKEAAGQGVLGALSAAVLAFEDVLTGIEGEPIDQPLVAALEDLPVPVELADVEPVVEDVRQGR